MCSPRAIALTSAALLIVRQLADASFTANRIAFTLLCPSDEAQKDVSISWTDELMVANFAFEYRKYARGERIYLIRTLTAGNC
jgi:hypothetical protein